MCVSRWHDGLAKILFPINAGPDGGQCLLALGLTTISVEKEVSGFWNWLEC